MVREALTMLVTNSINIVLIKSYIILHYFEILNSGEY